MKKGYLISRDQSDPLKKLYIFWIGQIGLKIFTGPNWLKDFRVCVCVF